MKSLKIKKMIVLGICMILVGGITGCSSKNVDTNNSGNNQSNTEGSSTSTNNGNEVNVKEIPADWLKDYKMDHKTTVEVGDNDTLGSFKYKSTKNYDNLKFTNDVQFKYSNSATSEYEQGAHLFFRGAKAKNFVIEHFGEFGYDEKFMNNYISEMGMNESDLCFFLMRTDSITNGPKEFLKDGETKDSYMLGFITDEDHTLNFYNMVTHEMYSYLIS